LTVLAPRTFTMRSDLLLGIGAGLTLGLVATAFAGHTSRFAVLALLVVAAPFVGAIVGVRRLLLTALVLDVALKWDVNLFFRVGPYPGGLDISLTTMAVLAAYALWLAERLCGRGERLRLVPALVPLLFVGVEAASMLVATDKAVALFKVVLLVQSLLVFVYLASTLDRGEIVFVMRLFFVGTIIASASALLAYATGHTFDIAGLTGQGYASRATGHVTRPGGTVGSPNDAGAFLAVALPPALAMLTAPVGRSTKTLAGVSFVLGTTALIVTRSRGGWLAFTVALAVLAILSLRRRHIRARVPLAGLATVLVLAVPLHSLIWHRLTGSDAGAAAARVPLMHLAWRMIRSHPLLGIGANNFWGAIPRYAGPEYTGDWLNVVHNEYLLIWAEAGILALALFVAFLGVVIARAWRCSRTPDPLLAPLSLGFVASLVGLLPNLFVERFVNYGQLWLLAGVVTAVYVRLPAGEPADERVPAADLRRARPAIVRLT
jgi:putative inorganic carbon (hco3(-)) transporter